MSNMDSDSTRALPGYAVILVPQSVMHRILICKQVLHKLKLEDVHRCLKVCLALSFSDFTIRLHTTLTQFCVHIMLLGVLLIHCRTTLFVPSSDVPLLHAHK